MLKKILLPLDGSENAERALPWAKRLAARETAQVVLFRVIPRNRHPEVPAADRAEARDYLLRLEKEFNYAGIPTKVLLRRGAPAKEIVDVAREQECDLILMATRGGLKFRRWALGGVAERVIRRSSVPVLPIRGNLVLPRQGHVRRVIVPVDGSKRAEATAWWAGRLAQLLKAKLVFLHVYPDGNTRPRGWTPRVFVALQNRLTKLCASFTRHGVKASFRLQRGEAAARILNYADENDLILTTTHGFGGLKRWVFGSVAERLVQEATVPVLVYKAPA
jgi:nucleotide-binding universal stress UspA family protein